MDGNEIRSGTTTPSGAGEIVVGLDDSPAAAAALRWAAEQARVTGQRLQVVHAWQMTAVEAAAVASGGQDFLEAANADARAQVTRWVLDALGNKARDVRWRLEIIGGRPGQVLTARSRAARLLVIGTHKRTGLLGSAANYCLSHANVPVAVVPLPAVPTPARSSRRARTSRDVLVTAGPLL